MLLADGRTQRSAGSEAPHRNRGGAGSEGERELR